MDRNIVPSTPKIIYLQMTGTCAKCGGVSTVQRAVYPDKRYQEWHACRVCHHIQSKAS